MYATARLPAVALAAAVVAALLPGPLWLDVLAVNLAVAVALVIDIVAAPRPASLQATLDVPGVVALDRPARATLRLHNPTGRRLRVAAHEAAAPSTGLDPPRQATVLEPRARGVLEATFTPSRRGHVRVGPLTLRTAGPLGLGGRQRTLPVVARLKCYPALPGRKQAELRLQRARLLQSGYRLSSIRGGGGEFDSLREYHPDDEFRRINWRATARSTRTISNTYREERNQQVLLLVDASRTMAGTVAGVPRFEHTLDAGIALAELAGRVGDHVGMAAFGADVLVTAGPRSGRTQARRILDLLFDVQPSLDAPNYRRVFASVLTRYRRRALLVLLTELTDQAAMEGLFQALPMLMSRHLVVVASVVDPAIEAEATEVPVTSADAYGKAAAAASIVARSDTAGRLVAMGATVVDRPPQDLAGALADQYLRIKSLGTL
jgi:uncharacterized protein (DUF58 family)